MEEPADAILKLEEVIDSRFRQKHWELSTVLCGIASQKMMLSQPHGAKSLFRR
jgi:hypothetical protein